MSRIAIIVAYYDPVALEATILESKENLDFSNVPKIPKLAFLKSLGNRRDKGPFILSLTLL